MFNSVDVGMSSIQAYKAHKQEGTLVCKQGAQTASGMRSTRKLKNYSFH